MGRRDAVQFTLELAAEWRRLGAEVTFEPGWETRGNGTSANYEGGNVHHTGYGSSAVNPTPALVRDKSGRRPLIDGRPDLTGPLCNTTGPWCPPDRPRIHVIAAHPANHAGASGGRGTAPMPVTSLFNPRSYGHEIDYGGNVPMSPGQYTAALIWSRGLATVLGRSIDYVRAHAETSVTGKWDPGYAPGKTLDMAVFRRDAAAYQGDDMPLNQSDLNAISVIVRDWSKGGIQAPTIDWGGGRVLSVAQQAADNAKGIAALSGQVAALLEAVRGLANDGIDLAAVKAAAEAGTEEALSGFQATVTIAGGDGGHPATGPVS